MIAEIVCCLGAVIVSWTCPHCQLEWIYLPWMLMTGFEIVGNLTAFVIFLTCPGKFYAH